MSKKYINKPVKVSTLLPKILNAAKKKNSCSIPEIKSNWREIIGDQLFDKCFAFSIKKINKNNVLTIISNEGSLLELSYESQNIKERINRYFAYEMVNEIKFKKSFQL